MKELKEVLEVPIGGNEVLKQCFILDGDSNARTLLSSVGTTFIDLDFWLRQQKELVIVSRSELVKLFCEYVFNLWSNRHGCKIIVIVMDKPRYLPVWELNSFKPSKSSNNDPYPHLWDDKCLGGPMGFSNWIKNPMSRLECMRTLMDDVISISKQNPSILIPNFSQNSEKVVIFDVDLPIAPFLIKSEKSEYLRDFSVCGLFGHSYSTFMSYIDAFENLFENEQIKLNPTSTNYEIITDNIMWILMSVLRHYREQGDKFNGSAKYDKNNSKDDIPGMRIWWRNESIISKLSGWMSCKSWYFMLKVVHFEIFEPLGSLLLLYKIREDETLFGTRFKRLKFSVIWAKFLSWSKQRSNENKNHVICFIDPSNGIIHIDSESYRSFFLFIHSENDSMILDGNIDVDYNTITLKSLEKWMETKLNSIKDFGWRSILAAHIQNIANPLNLINKDISVRSLWAKKIFEYFSTNLWVRSTIDQICDTVFDSDTQNDQDARFFIKKQYGVNLQTELTNKMEKLIEELKNIQIDDKPFVLSKKVGSIFNEYSPKMGPMYELIMKTFGESYYYVKTNVLDILKTSFLHVFWRMIEMAIGSKPYFLKKRFYGPADIWGWNKDNGFPLISNGILDWTLIYSNIDSERFFGEKIQEKYYVFPDFTKRVNFEPLEEKQVVLSDVLLDSLYETENMSFFSLVPDELKVAYAYETIQENIDILHLNYPIVKTFISIRQLYSQNLSNNKIKFFWSVIRKVFDFIKNNDNLIPLYAEKMLGELFDRVYMFLSYKDHKTIEKIIDSSFEKENVIEYAKNGLFGRMIDSITQSVNSIDGMFFARYYVTLDVYGDKYSIIQKLKYGPSLEKYNDGIYIIKSSIDGEYYLASKITKINFDDINKDQIKLEKIPGGLSNNLERNAFLALKNYVVNSSDTNFWMSVFCGSNDDNQSSEPQKSLLFNPWKKFDLYSLKYPKFFQYGKDYNLIINIDRNFDGKFIPNNNVILVVIKERKSNLDIVIETEDYSPYLGVFYLFSDRELVGIVFHCCFWSISRVNAFLIDKGIISQSIEYTEENKYVINVIIKKLT